MHPTANLDNDLEEFRPERWLVEDKGITDLLEARRDHVPPEYDAPIWSRTP